VSITKTSAAGRQLIECFEGLFLKAYDDGEGVLTIGYGHTSSAGQPPVARGMVITAVEADSVLSRDLAPCEARVTKLVTAPVTQHEFDALVSFEFNTGDLARSSIPAKVNAGRRSAAMDTLLQYVHGSNSGKLYAGLVRRRKAERLMFEGDVDGALKLAGVHTGSADMMPRKGGPGPVGAQSFPSPRRSPSPPPKRPLLAAFLSFLKAILKGRST
jgi:lysozyme